MGLGKRARADQLKSLACSSGDKDAPSIDAPSIVHGLTGYEGHDSIIKDTGPEAPVLIEAILGPDCPVNAALTKSDEAALKKLAEHKQPGERHD